MDLFDISGFHKIPKLQKYSVYTRKKAKDTS